VKEVFRNPDHAQVSVFAAILENEGIPCFTQNPILEQVLGTGWSPNSEFWPVLCVLDDDDYPEAMKVLTELRNPDQPSEKDWKCAACGETVPGNFARCWNCQAARESIPE
jgi:Putative prokaryotic signal transducing protein